MFRSLGMSVSVAVLLAMAHTWLVTPDVEGAFVAMNMEENLHWIIVETGECPQEKNREPVACVLASCLQRAKQVLDSGASSHERAAALNRSVSQCRPVQMEIPRGDDHALLLCFCDDDSRRMRDELRGLPWLSRETKTYIVPSGKGLPWWLPYAINRNEVLVMAGESLEAILNRMRAAFPEICLDPSPCADSLDVYCGFGHAARVSE